MNFFKRQEDARRRTKLLFLYLVLIVVVIVAFINVLLIFLWMACDASIEFMKEPGSILVPYPQGMTVGQWMDWHVNEWLGGPAFTATSLLVLGLLVFLTIRGYHVLREGGHAVARLMGARPVELTSRDIDYRRLVNVVEEMSIAAGTSVPTLYVMHDESGINLFVAGYGAKDAVLVVTHGAVKNFDRDQLQGVVAHEYSHMLNGDMRLNLQLMALVSGITVIPTTGRIMMGGHFLGYRIKGEPTDRESPLWMVGVLLYAIGYTGLFFARLIKAAISRQREFLADASAIQLTRNPDGLAEALWVIRDHPQGSALFAPNAEHTAHMCFGQSISMRFENLLATHPPIDERIHAINPRSTQKQAAESVRRRQAERIRTAVAKEAAARVDNVPLEEKLGPITAAAIVASVGNPTASHANQAIRLLREMPEKLVENAHVPERARLVVYALVLGDVAVGREDVALALLDHQEKTKIARVVERLHKLIGGLEIEQRLPLFELALPSLKRLPEPQRQRFLEIVDKLVRVDRTVTVFEFVLQALLSKHLGHGATSEGQLQYKSLRPVLPQIQLLLSLLARTGAEGDMAAQAAFNRATAALSIEQTTLADPEQCLPESMVEILRRLSGLTPNLKEQLIEACVECLLHDGLIAVTEAELMRAIADTLDCPMPPLVNR